MYSVQSARNQNEVPKTKIQNTNLLNFLHKAFAFDNLRVFFRCHLQSVRKSVYKMAEMVTKIYKKNSMHPSLFFVTSEKKVINVKSKIKRY